MFNIVILQYNTKFLGCYKINFFIYFILKDFLFNIFTFLLRWMLTIYRLIIDLSDCLFSIIMLWGLMMRRDKGG